jgi:hypothetical protein
MCLIYICSSHWLPWVGYGVSVGVILVLLAVTWTHYIWTKLKDPHEEQDYIAEPTNKLLNLLYQASLKVVWSAITRTVLYMAICISMSVCTMLELVSLTLINLQHLNTAEANALFF